MILKFLNTNQKNYLQKLELILGARKLKQQDQSSNIKQILFNVKKYGDKAVLKYEKKFSKIKTNNKRIKFTKKEINRILVNLDANLKRSIDTAFKRIRFFLS